MTLKEVSRFSACESLLSSISLSFIFYFLFFAEERGVLACRYTLFATVQHIDKYGMQEFDVIKP